MSQQDYTIYDYWRIIRRRKITVIASTLFVVTAAFYFTSRKKPIYNAEVTCEISNRMSSGTESTGYYIWYPNNMMETESRIATSRIVLERTLRKLGLIKEKTSPTEIDRLVESLRGKTRVRGEGNTNIVKIEVKDGKPDRAALFANTVAQIYIEFSSWRRNENNKSLRDYMSSQLAYVSEKLRISEEALLRYKKTGSISGIKNEFERQLGKLRLNMKNALNQYTDKHPKVMDLNDKIRELEESLSLVSKDSLVQTRLKREIKINEELYFLLNRRYKEMLVASAGDPPRVRILNPAIIPERPINISGSVNMIISLIVGLVFGVIMAFFREHLDTSIGTIEELEELLKLPVLGVIPLFTHLKQQAINITDLKKRSGEDLRARLAIFNDPRSTVAEAYRTLETNVEFSNRDNNDNTILFTSTTMREGKSVSAANFAMAAAQANRKVLLVEADFRAPVLHKIFGVPKENGFSELLLGKNSISEVMKGTSDFVLGDLNTEQLQKTQGIDNLKIITSGRIPLNPVQLLKSDKFLSFIEEVKDKFDLVIFDSSPILPVADPTVISSKVGSVLVVYKVGMVARGALKRAIDQLQQASANVVGVILNQIHASEMRRKDSYYRYYHKYYGESEPEI